MTPLTREDLIAMEPQTPATGQRLIQACLEYVLWKRLLTLFETIPGARKSPNKAVFDAISRVTLSELEEVITSEAPTVDRQEAVTALREGFEGLRKPRQQGGWGFVWADDDVSDVLIIPNSFLETTWKKWVLEIGYPV